VLDYIGEIVLWTHHFVQFPAVYVVAELEVVEEIGQSSLTPQYGRVLSLAYLIHVEQQLPKREELLMNLHMSDDILRDFLMKGVRYEPRVH
jgi:hypothetical protein